MSEHNGRVNGNLLSHWVPIGAVLLALGAAFSVGAVYSQLGAELELHNHPAMMKELGEIKEMVARIDERTKLNGH